MSNTVKIKTKRTGDITKSTPKAIRQAVGHIMEKAFQNAKEEAPIKTGRLSGKAGGEGGIHYEIEEQGFRYIGILTATARNPQTGVDYSPFVHDGTGIHGETGKPITPKKAKFLVFLRDGRPNPTTPDGWKKEVAAGNVIFARSVKGMKGKPYLSDGLRSAWKDSSHIFKAEFQLVNNEVK